MKSRMVDGRWPVVDLGVPPFLLAEVKMTAPFSCNNFGKRGWSGMRMPMVS